MRERVLSMGLRLLLGVIGAAAVCAALAVGATRTGPARPGASLPVALAVLLVCSAVAVGGVFLLRGAWRGRIAVRRPRARRRMR